SAAMLLLALLSLLVAPLACAFRCPRAAAASHRGQPAREQPASWGESPVSNKTRPALRDPGFWLISAGFGACGFHVGFLGAHMPGVVEACGQPAALAGAGLAIIGACNIVGSIVSGALTRTRSMPHM